MSLRVPGCGHHPSLLDTTGHSSSLVMKSRFRAVEFHMTARLNWLDWQATQRAIVNTLESIEIT